MQWPAIVPNVLNKWLLTMQINSQPVNPHDYKEQFCCHSIGTILPLNWQSRANEMAKLCQLSGTNVKVITGYLSHSIFCQSSHLLRRKQLNSLYTLFFKAIC
jgi:hypothetical protein